MRNDQVGNRPTEAPTKGNRGGHVMLCPQCRSGQIHHNTEEGGILTSKCTKCENSNRYEYIAENWIPEEFISVLDATVNAEIQRQYERIQVEESNSPEPENRRGILQRMKSRGRETTSGGKPKESYGSKPAAGGARLARGLFHRKPKPSREQLEEKRDTALEEARTYKTMGNIEMARKLALEAKQIQERIR